MKMLGSTVPVRNGIYNCFYYGDLWKCECIQIYSTLSRKWDINEFPDDDVAIRYKAAFKKSSVKTVVSHIPFLVNLCSKEAELQKKSIDRLRKELIYNNMFGINHTVLHPGSHINKIDAVKVIANNINNAIQKLNFKNKCTILLETMSGQGNYIGSLGEIANIISLIDDRSTVGVCLDTAHIYQNGYDLNKNYERVIRDIDNIIGLENIKVIHINDSLTPLNSHSDRHAFIGEGYIEIEAFKNIIDDPRFCNIPKILELPDINRSEEALNILKKL